MSDTLKVSDTMWSCASSTALDTTADRKAGVLRVNAIHEDVKLTRAIRSGVEAELDDLARWLELER